MARYELGTIATHHCDYRYFLEGNEERACVQDDQIDTTGVWNGTAPTCERMLIVFYVPVNNQKLNIPAIPPDVNLNLMGVDVNSIDPGREIEILCFSEGNFSGNVAWIYEGNKVQCKGTCMPI